jgi:hypothetical protein
VSWLANYASRWFSDWLGSIVDVIREDEDSRSRRPLRWPGRAYALAVAPLLIKLASVRTRVLTAVAATAVVKAAWPLTILLSPARAWGRTPVAATVRPLGVSVALQVGLARARAGARAGMQAGAIEPLRAVLGTLQAAAGAVPRPLTLTMNVGSPQWTTRASAGLLTELVAICGHPSHHVTAGPVPLPAVEALVGDAAAGAGASPEGVETRMFLGQASASGVDEEEELMELILTGVL